MHTVFAHQFIFFPLVTALKATGSRKQIPHRQIIFLRVVYTQFVVSSNCGIIIFASVVRIRWRGKNDWNALIKLVDDRKFDAIMMGWGGGSVDVDPKQIWHSASIPSPGSNFIGYSNPKVDQLIDRMRATMDQAKRTTMLREIHEMIAADAPYSFMFNRKFTLYANTARVRKKQELLKYDVGINTWTLQPQQ